MKPLRILVSGMVAAEVDQGGATWAVLQYALGLRELGHHVELLDPVERPTPASEAYFAGALREFGLVGRIGAPPRGRFDVLLNLSGRLALERLFSEIPIRVYVDIDPVFTQLWHLDGLGVGLPGHTHYASLGTKLPETGHDWISFLPPVALAWWDRTGEPRDDAFTTVGNWRGYGSIERDGVHYGQKAHSLRPLVELPGLVREPFELALAIHDGETEDIRRLDEHGWRLVSPYRVASTPHAYHQYVTGSRAEFGIAKSGYVVSRSGWFSDRSACYLASGRPVIAQDTGFGDRLPIGGGLFAFSTSEDVVEAAARLRADYGRQARGARAIAEEFLDARRVLGSLLRDVGAVDSTRRHMHQLSDDTLKWALAATSLLSRRPSPYRSSAPLVEADVLDSDGVIQRLVVKDLSRDALTERARRAKPVFLADSRREAVVYRDLLDGAGLGAPSFFSFAEGLLALERVDAVPLEEIGELDVWRRVFVWLAGLHDRFRGVDLPAPLLRYDAPLLERLAGSAAIQVRRAARRLGSTEPTLVHGDLYPANVLIGGTRVCAVDWELAGAGSGLLDVASLSMGWDEAEQHLLVEAYRTALADPPGAETFRRAMRNARLVVASRWVNARRTVSAPPEHDHDFGAELKRYGVVS